MEYVIAALLLIGSFFVAMIGNLIANDVYDQSAWIAERILCRAVKRLPLDQQARYREEWLSHLYDCSGKLGMLVHALGCDFASRKIARIPSCTRTVANVEHRDELSGQDIYEMYRSKLGRFAVTIETSPFGVTSISFQFFDIRHRNYLIETLETPIESFLINGKFEYFNAERALLELLQHARPETIKVRCL